MAYKKLKNLDKAWDNAKDEFGDSTGGFETVPSGNYVVGKITCEFDEDTLVIKRKQTILEGEHADFTINDRMNLDPEVAPRGVEFCLKWFNLLGYEIDTLSKDLDDTLEAINENTGATFGVSVKEKNGFNNVFYNKVIDEGEDNSSTSSDANTTGRGEMPDIDDMKTRKLKKLITDEQLDVTIEDDMDDDDLKDAIEAAWDKPAKKEKSSKKRESAKVEKPTSRRGKKADKADDSKLTKDLFNLGDAFGLDVTEDMDLKELKKFLKDFTFKKKDLEKAEIKVFEDAGLESVLT